MTKHIWFPEIPSGWSVVPGRAVLRQRRDRSARGDELLLSVSEYSGVVPRSTIVDDGDPISRADSLIGYRRCSPGELAMNIMLAWKRGLAVSSLDGIVSPSYAVFGFTAGYVARYYHYLLRTDLYSAIFGQHSTGIIASRWRLYPETLMGLPMIAPPTDVQLTIADFLDRETAEADALVAKYERLIELLEEKRIALITQAVTKGLDPNVPMKISGYAWLPSVPRHWSVTPLKHLTSIPITDGPHETPNFLPDGIAFVSAEAVSSGRLDFSKVRGYISSLDHDRYSRKYSPVRGDIFIIKSGATTGVSAIVDTDEVFDIWSPLAAVRCGPKALPPYLLQVIRSRVFQDSIALHWNFGTQQNIGMSVLENLPVPVPPVSEQQTVLKYLEEQIAEIDETQNRVRRAFGLSFEHRAALITSAVTGQIDVTNYRSKKQSAEVFA